MPDNPATRPGATDFDRRLGLKIRQLRISLGLNQQQLAERIGVTYQQMFKYERGLNRISLSRLEALCSVLGWTIADALAGLSQPPRPLTTSERQRMDAAQLFARLSPHHATAVLKLMRVLAGEAEGDL
jgi:transcriptional regulator with XRE-family HTH domain